MIARFAWCLALAGCQLVFGQQPEPPPGPDAPPDAPACTGKFSPNIELVLEQDGSTKFDPATNELGELWFTVVGNSRDIRLATPDGEGGFETHTAANFNDPTADDYDPAASADGNRLLFISTRLGGSRVFEIVRNAGMFGDPALLANVPPVEGIDISDDGLRLYFNDPMGLHVMERPDLGAAFANRRLLALDGDYPSISGDELEVYYNVELARIARRTRPNATTEFGSEESPLEGTTADFLDGNDAEISPDGTTLMYAVDNQILAIRRPCQL